MQPLIYSFCIHKMDPMIRISDSSNAMNEPALKFHSYLRESSDVYLVRSLAIIGLDVIRWLGKFYDKYAEIKPFEFIPFEGKVVELSKNMGGAIVISPIGERYFIKQPNDNKERYHVGSNVRIKNRSITSPNFGDYFVQFYETDNLDK